MNLQLSTNLSSKPGEQVHRVCFSSHKGPWGLSEGQLGQGPPTRRVHALPGKLVFSTPRAKPKEAAARSIWRQVKGWAAPWPGGSWREAGGVGGGRSPALGRGLGSSGCKGIKPSRSQPEAGEALPCWERGLCRNVHAKHLSHRGQVGLETAHRSQ